MKNIDREISKFERKRFFKIVRESFFAITFISLIVALYIFKYQHDGKKLITESLVIGVMDSVSAQETHRGSNVIWIVRLVDEGRLVMVAPAENEIYKKGRKVELTKYSYDYGDDAYVFNKYVN